MTAEECLRRSLFAMVSKYCHARNAEAEATALGMLRSRDQFSKEDTVEHCLRRMCFSLFFFFFLNAHLNLRASLLFASETTSAETKMHLRALVAHKFCTKRPLNVPLKTTSPSNIRSHQSGQKSAQVCHIRHVK